MNNPQTGKILKLVLLLLLTFVSCYASETNASGISSPDFSNYTVEPQDKLNIQVNGEKDLSGIFTVDPNGDINYPLLGAIYVQDLSLKDIKQFLTDTLGKSYLVNPDVQVIFFEMPNRPILEPAPLGMENRVPPPAESFIKSAVTEVESMTVNSDAGARPEESDIVDIGDKLNIQVYKEPDISGVFTVNSSGKIGYPLIGEIYAQSLSLDELKQFLFDKLNEKYVSNPQIEITITESPNKSVSVLGQVTKPGNYILTHQLTLLKLISQNGGFTPDAATKTVRIVRSREDGKKETLEVNVDKVIQGQDKDPALKSGDIIFVDFQNKEEAKKEVLKNYITVLGQVSRPGNYFFSSKLTLIRLVGEAGGFTPVAATSRVKIIRQTKEGKQASFMVDAGSIMNGSKDVELAEGDLIIVPESFF